MDGEEIIVDRLPITWEIESGSVTLSIPRLKLTVTLQIETMNPGWVVCRTRKIVNDGKTTEVDGTNRLVLHRAG